MSFQFIIHGQISIRF